MSDWTYYPGDPEQRISGAARGGESRKYSINWALTILLLGLAAIGGCSYSFGRLAESADIFSRTIHNPGVGVLVIEEEIFGSIWVTEALHQFEKDPLIKSVVIRINSPGGAVAPCQEIYQMVRAMDKPVVVSMGSIAASGGLYIAAAGDMIIANPGTLTGSIGVIMQSIEVSGALDKIGLKSQTIKSGDYKDIGSPFREMRPEERDLLKTLVMDVYEQFVTDLIHGRPKMQETAVRRLANGCVFSGAEAVKLGLVDELGGFEDALLRAARMGGLPLNQRPELVFKDGRQSWWETLLKSKFNLSLMTPPALTPGLTLKYIYQSNI
ncbi:MAG: hypothetical protein AMR96_01445 [Candidatus Adiutrix intracellularis]|nr:MAG: hypothetical protein AMR96_01445 [Candidatus Adiutrix intracellularis]MDR2827327.1 signal peptide peptidase SppA [Candidatus Adiutrix intracellularis]